MSIARKDDRHNADLAREIADSFNRTMRAGNGADEGESDTADDDGQREQRFVITGDQRTPPRGRRAR